MRVSSPKLTRSEAQQRLSAFIGELDAGWERDKLDWGLELLVVLRAFDRAARREPPDLSELDSCRKQVLSFVGGKKPLKGLSFLITYVDAICDGSE
jgi:hypothetical protein